MQKTITLVVSGVRTHWITGIGVALFIAAVMTLVFSLDIKPTTPECTDQPLRQMPC